MTGEVWHQQLESYLALRRALGFTMRPEERLLRDFVTHLDQRSDAASVAQVAVEWSMATAGVSHARRLSIVRGFLTMARATDPCIVMCQGVDYSAPVGGPRRICSRRTKSSR